MSDKTIFEKIRDREIPAEMIYEDEDSMCFKDIEPQSPTHFLLVPKKLISRIGATDESHASLLGHLLTRIPIIAQQEGFLEDGFRIVINNGPDGGEAVPHLHIHILAGRKMQWPPG